MLIGDTTASYWLFGWLDSHRIKSVPDIRRALGDKAHIEELREVSEQWRASASNVNDDGINLVAGTGLRLDDLLTCPSLPCRQQQVDVLFRHAWHYFDRILLPDGVGHLLENGPRNQKTSSPERQH